MKTDVSKSLLRGGCEVRNWAWLGLLCFAIGCTGGGGPADNFESMSPDQQEIDMLVGSVADNTSNLARFREMFTKDAAPSEADRQKYSKMMFSVNGDIQVTGSTAAFDVTMTSTEDPAAPPIDKAWKATKDGDTWKLSEAPLP